MVLSRGVTGLFEDLDYSRLQRLRKHNDKKPAPVVTGGHFFLLRRGTEITEISVLRGKRQVIVQVMDFRTPHRHVAFDYNINIVVIRRIHTKCILGSMRDFCTCKAFPCAPLELLQVYVQYMIQSSFAKAA